jgi:hypothetical protein
MWGCEQCDAKSPMNFKFCSKCMTPQPAGAVAAAEAEAAAEAAVVPLTKAMLAVEQQNAAHNSGGMASASESSDGGSSEIAFSVGKTDEGSDVAFSSAGEETSSTGTLSLSDLASEGDGGDEIEDKESDDGNAAAYDGFASAMTPVLEEQSLPSKSVLKPDVPFVAAPPANDGKGGGLRGRGGRKVGGRQDLAAADDGATEKSVEDVAKAAVRPSAGRVLTEAPSQQQHPAESDADITPDKMIPMAPHQIKSTKQKTTGLQQKATDWQEAGAVAAQQLQAALKSGDADAFAAAAAAAADAAAGSGSDGFASVDGKRQPLQTLDIAAIIPGSMEEAQLRAAKGLKLQQTLQDATTRHEQVKERRRKQQYDRERKKMDVSSVCRFMTYPAAANGTTSTTSEHAGTWYRPAESDLEQQIKLVEASVEKMRLSQRSRESKLKGWAARLGMPEPALPTISTIY